jgi:integrase
MPRLVSALPKYRRHKPSGRAVVTLGGKDYYLGAHGTQASKRKYEQLIAEYLSSGRSQSFGTKKTELTIVELAVAYLKFAKGYYGTGDSSEYKRCMAIVRPLRELYGRSAAAEFTPVQLKALRQSCVDKDWSRSYINANIRRIVRMFRWAAAEGLLAADVPQSLSMVPGLRAGKCNAREADPVTPVDDAVVAATHPHLPVVVADMVQFQRLTACRPAEVCQLRPIDLDRTGDVWHYRPQHHKTQHHGHERVISVGPRAQAVLLRYLVRDPETPCFRPCDSVEKHLAAKHEARKTPMSCGNSPGTNRQRRPRRKPGTMYKTSSYRRAINRACDRAFPHPTLGDDPNTLQPLESAQLRKWRRDHRWAPNQLRHTAATEIRRQFGLEAAQIVLGHAHADVTQVYAERNLKLGSEVAKAIG